MKTKATLLAVMRRRSKFGDSACQQAIGFVETFNGDNARDIGHAAVVEHSAWLHWFLQRRLTWEGRMLLADRMQRAWDGPRWNHSPAQCKVLLECWDAWCAS